MKQAEQYLTIEGILNEIDLEEATYKSKKTGETVECLRGMIKVKTEITLDGETVPIELPVYAFVNKYTQKGELHMGYKSLKKVKDEFVSVGSGVGEDKADRVRIKGASIRSNEYWSNDKLISYPRINASFVERVSASEMRPLATFDSITFVVQKTEMVPDPSDAQSMRLCVTGIVPMYNDEVDVIQFYTKNPEAIRYIQQAWQQGSTVSASGILNFTAKVVEEVTASTGFGEPTVKKHTEKISELIITAGTAPFDAGLAYDIDEIQTAIKNREARLADRRQNQKAKSAQVKSQSAPSVSNALGLGF